MKHTYDGIEDFLTQISQTIASTISKQNCFELNVIFFPQIGFLISTTTNSDAVQADYKGPPDEHWDRIFSTVSRTYYKDFRMRELDETFGDVYAVICGKSSYFGCFYRFSLPNLLPF